MYIGRFAEAEAYCRRCLQQRPDFVPAYATLSRLRDGALRERGRAALYDDRAPRRSSI